MVVLGPGNSPRFEAALDNIENIKGKEYRSVLLLFVMGSFLSKGLKQEGASADACNHTLNFVTNSVALLLQALHMDERYVELTTDAETMQKLALEDAADIANGARP